METSQKIVCDQLDLLAHTINKVLGNERDHIKFEVYNTSDRIESGENFSDTLFIPKLKDKNKV